MSPSLPLGLVAQISRSYSSDIRPCATDCLLPFLLAHDRDDLETFVREKMWDPGKQPSLALMSPAHYLLSIASHL